MNQTYDRELVIVSSYFLTALQIWRSELTFLRNLGNKKEKKKINTTKLGLGNLGILTNARWAGPSSGSQGHHQWGKMWLQNTTDMLATAHCGNGLSDWGLYGPKTLIGHRCKRRRQVVSSPHPFKWMHQCNIRGQVGDNQIKSRQIEWSLNGGWSSPDENY